MKFKNTFILLVAAVAIYAFIYFFESKQPTSQQAAEQAGRVVHFDREKITGITIKNTDTKIQLSKKDGTWFIDAPLKDHADSMAVNELFTDAENLRSDESIPTDKQGKDLLKDFGLANPETRLTFTGGDKPVELLFGKDAAVEGKIYVRLEDSKVAHVISNNLKNQITKKVDDFRDHKLTDLLTTQVDKVVLKVGTGEIELDRKDQHWSLAKPFKARGNDQQVNDLISQAANALVSSFIADHSDLAKYGLQEPRGSVTFTSEGSKKPVVLQFGNFVEKEKDKLYVKLSTRDAVMVVPKSVAAILDTTPNTLRDRNLLRVSADIVDRINIESPGKEKIVLARKGESWVRKAGGKDVPVNVAAAARLLSTLQNEQVTDFVSDVATDLPKYGLDQPAETITLSSYASENTAETKAGEKPIVSVLFGKTEKDSVYAKLDDEPFVVSVSKNLLDVAMTDPLQWQELTIYKNKPEDVTSVEITHEGQPTISIERDKDKNWVLAKGDGKLQQSNVDSMVNTLSNLRAVRWIGATAPDQGLAQPKTVVSFKTASGQGKLSLGGETSDMLTYATAEGLTGTFGMSQPDVSAFQLPLIQGAPAATPAPRTPAVTPGANPAPAPAPQTTPPVSDKPAPSPATTPQAAPPTTTPERTTAPAPVPPVLSPVTPAVPGAPAPAPATPAPQPNAGPASTPTNPAPATPAPAPAPLPSPAK
ncbi:MAG TPA: DUF4340 domain-containing protein [Chthoniobacter sp.]|jgi:hypothetical protein